jgi:hypothetical protein
VEETAKFNANHAFLRDEFFSLTLMAAVQRGDVYTAEARESARKTFRLELRRKLEEIAWGYHKPVGENAHLKNICLLADHLTKNHSETLKRRRFRIGTAQKALNLYLKYLWCIGAITEPPHCPFDFQIIRRLRGFGQIRWTTLDDIESYKLLVAAARHASHPLSIAQWELEAYNALMRVPQKN